MGQQYPRNLPAQSYMAVILSILEGHSVPVTGVSWRKMFLCKKRFKGQIEIAQKKTTMDRKKKR